jgi:hypothetical protein
MKRFLLIIFCFPFVLFSQNKRIVFVEGGTSINQSFYPKETVSGKLYGWCASGDEGSIGNYHSLIQRKSTYSFYSKMGIGVNVVEKKHFSLSFPMILGYRELKESSVVQTEATYHYYIAPYKYTEKYENNYRMISLIFGPSAKMNFNKWSYFTSLNLNADLFCYGKMIYKKTDPFGEFTNETQGGVESVTSKDVLFNLSLQNGILYNLSEKLALGLTNELFFYNIDPYNIRYNKKDNHFFNLGYGTNSTIINTGIRLQYSF